MKIAASSHHGVARPSPKKNPLIRVLRFFKVLYLKLFRINDTPRRIAAGVGLGVLFGVMPGTGPLAALFVAFVLRVNRAAALLGSLVTNTWLSIPLFVVAVKAGGAVTGTRPADIAAAWAGVAKDFSLKALGEATLYRIAIPVVLGYCIVAIAVGGAAYAVTLGVATFAKRRKGRSDGSQ